MKKEKFLFIIYGIGSGGMIAYLWSICERKTNTVGGVVISIGIGVCVGLISLAGRYIWKRVRKKKV